MEEKKEGKSRFPGTEMERVEVNPQSGSLPRDCPEKRQIKDRGKFGYAFANHELAMTFVCVRVRTWCVCVCVCTRPYVYRDRERLLQRVFRTHDG